jgi:Lrp/AsnC family leucine-responsive transcriptional regulator
MDELDHQILKYLKENSRMRISVISQKINLSVTAIIDRIKKLEASGIIKQYTTIIDPGKIGKDITAFISVSLEHPKYNDEFVSMVTQNSEILECHYITGDYDFLLKVVTGGSGSLERVLNYVKSLHGVAITRTLVVLSTLKNEISILPEVQKNKKK